MFDYRLIELEAEQAAKEQSRQGFAHLPAECMALLEFAERDVGIVLGGPVPKDWHGWLYYRRGKDALVVCRGRAFAEGGKFRAGLDVAYGLDTITEYKRGFDVSPPQDLDHLLLNFGQDGDEAK